MERVEVEEEEMSGWVSKRNDENSTEVHSSDPDVMEIREALCCKVISELILREERVIFPEEEVEERRGELKARLRAIEKEEKERVPEEVEKSGVEG